MSIKYVFFDLDGTLLPMDQDLFSKKYFVNLTRKLASQGYDIKEVEKSIQNVLASMIKNDGYATNEAKCWGALAAGLGEGILNDKSGFDDFYENDFDKLIDTCGCNPMAANVISQLHIMGIKPVLATNPLFPSVATEKRIKWAGLNKNDFEYVSTYENSCFSKPNPMYYTEILDKLKLNADECMMVGNDTAEDMIAASLGMKVFLVTDCLINKNNIDISLFPHGNLEALLEYIKININ